MSRCFDNCINLKYQRDSHPHLGEQICEERCFKRTLEALKIVSEEYTKEKMSIEERFNKY
jgi:hypothetical protein